MVNFTSKTYQMKREILSFSNKISRKLPKPDRKFIVGTNYGMLASTVACLQTLLPHYMSCPKSLTVLTIFLDICRKAHPAPPQKTL